MLESVARALAVDGWFLFDVNTPLSLRTQYAQTNYWDEAKANGVQACAAREPRGGRAASEARLRLVRTLGRVWRHVRETLWHVCWTDAEIRRALRIAGFDRVRRLTEWTCARAWRTRSAGQMPITSPENDGTQVAILRVLGELADQANSTPR